MDDTITQTALTGTQADSAGASVGSGAGSETEVAVEVKDLLKTVLNKDFPTNEAAIKSIQDTFKYVGEMGQKVKTLETENQQLQTQVQASPDLAAKVDALTAEVRDTKFYALHPEYNIPQVKALITDMGGNPEEVIQKESFKTAFTALKTTAEMEQSKSVLHTNPRLGVVQDNISKAVEAQKAGNDGQAAANATLAVIEAFGLK